MRRKLIVRGIGIVLIVLVLLVYIGLPFAVGFYATRPVKKAVGEAPEGYRELTLTTEDNIRIAAWYAPPENGAVIILLAGANGTRASTKRYAAMLREHGFGILALDLRGHGESEGNANQFGWEGTLDVGAAVEFLRGQAEVEAIGGLGTSLGGEVLLGAASRYPELQAIVSDGASQRSVEEYTALDYQRPLYRNFTVRVLYFSVGLFSGDEPPLPIADSIQAAAETRFLFIAGDDNNTEVDYNEFFRQLTDGRSQLWVAPRVGHVGAFGEYQGEYEQRVIAFFEAALLK